MATAKKPAAVTPPPAAEAPPTQAAASVAQEVAPKVEPPTDAQLSPGNESGATDSDNGDGDSREASSELDDLGEHAGLQFGSEPRRGPRTLDEAVAHGTLYPEDVDADGVREVARLAECASGEVFCFRFYRDRLVVVVMTAKECFKREISL